MIPRAWIFVGALLGLAASFGLGLGAGYRYRDARCEAAASRGETVQAQAETKAVTEARQNDHDTNAAVAQVEQHAAEQEQKREVVFQTIDREVIRYVQSPPAAAGCTVDADFLRIWSAAAAGRADGEPGRAAGQAGGMSARPASDR